MASKPATDATLRSWSRSHASGRPKKTGSANVLDYSQPAISYQIQCLERSLNVKLFTRKPSGSVLTRAGKKVLPAARAIVSLSDDIMTMSEEAASLAVPMSIVEPRRAAGTTAESGELGQERA